MGRRGTEFEIKLTGAPRDVAKLRRARRYRRRAEEPPLRERLVATYYDSRDGALRKEGVSLRLRDEGGAQIQSIKREPRGEGALRRYEEEILLKPGAEFPAPAADAAISALLARAGPLSAVSRTVSDRWSVPFMRGDAQIEIAVDLGRIETLDGDRVLRAAALAEIELELLSGSADAVFAEARRLVRRGEGAYRVAMRPKAARARALRRNKPYPDIPKMDYARDASRGDVLAAGLYAAASHLCDLQDAVADMRAPAALHQMRIGLRRLQILSSIFRKSLGTKTARKLKSRLRAISAASSRARDWDVFVDEMLAPLKAEGAALPLIGPATRLRSAAWERAAASVACPGFGLFILDLLEQAALAPRDARPAAPFARKALTRLGSSCAKKAASLDWSDTAQRHRLRLDLKALRYALHLFAPLFDAKACALYDAELGALQDEFGVLNDAASATRFADRAARGGGAATTRAAGFVYGYYAGAAEGRAQSLEEKVDRLLALEPPWSGSALNAPDPILRR